MRTEDLLEAIGEADDKLLERSEKAIHKKNHSWKKWVPLAACACVVIGLGMLGSMYQPKKESAAENTVLDSAGSIEQDEGNSADTEVLYGDELKLGANLGNYDGVITEIGEAYISVRLPEENETSMEISVCDDTEIVVQGKKASMDDLAVGDVIHVTYCGGIMESYPGRITQVLKIEVIE